MINPKKTVPFARPVLKWAGGKTQLLRLFEQTASA